jgi:hypothetical protein
MHRLVDAHEQLARREREAGAARHARLKAGVTEIILGEARRYGWRLSTEELLKVFADDIDLNAQGLADWLDTLKAV